MYSIPFCMFFSRVLRDSTPRFVRPSVHPSVGLSVGRSVTFSFFVRDGISFRRDYNSRRVGVVVVVVVVVDHNFKNGLTFERLD